MSDSDRQLTGWVDDLLFHAQGEARYAKRCKAILRQCGVPEDAIPADLEGILAELGLGGLEFEDDHEFEAALKTRARAWCDKHRGASGGMTRPLTKQELAHAFGVSRNAAQEYVLDRYYHEAVGGRFRLRVMDMPGEWRVKHLGG